MSNDYDINDGRVFRNLTFSENEAMAKACSRIAQVQASVRKMHGDERAQAVKHKDFIAFQLRQREQQNGLDPSPILKK